MAITLQQASFIFGCLVATALTIMSVYSWFRSTYLSLPMPRLALLLSALIPFANLFGLRHFVQDLQYNGHSLSPEVLGLIGIADAVLMTLASAQLQLDHLSCSLDHQWQILFSHKDSGHIRRIQDGLNCCGFKTTHDRAWPFPDNQTATACERTLHRRSSCLPGWKREEKTVLAFMIAIGGLSLLSKIIFFALRRSQSWVRWVAPEAPANRRLIGGGRRQQHLPEEPYTDEPANGTGRVPPRSNPLPTGTDELNHNEPQWR